MRALSKYKEYLMIYAIRTPKHVMPNGKFWNWNLILADCRTLNPELQLTREDLKYPNGCNIPAAGNYQHLGGITKHPVITKEHVQSFSPDKWDLPKLAIDYEKLNGIFMTEEEVTYVIKHQPVRIADFASHFQIAKSAASRLAPQLALLTAEQRQEIIDGL